MFCRRWAQNWKKQTGERVQYEPYQKVLAQFPQISEEACQEAVHLVLPDGSVFRGAHAVFKLLALGEKFFWLRAYEKFPFCAKTSEWAYRLVSRHRRFFSRFI